MAYCSDHHLIVSGGFCYDLIISNPYISSPISRLSGHSAPIIGVEHIVGTSQASSILLMHYLQKLVESTRPDAALKCNNEGCMRDMASSFRVG